MEMENAKQYIRENWRQLIGDIAAPAKNKVNRETSYICPICQQHGVNGDGLTFIPENPTTLKCFGCDWSGDIIQLYMDSQKIDFMTAVNLLAAKLNITVENDAAVIRARIDEKHNQDKTLAQDEKTAVNGDTDTSGVLADYTEYYSQCRGRINDPRAVSYLKGRGISVETANFFGAGYDPAADPAASGFPSARLIIPTCSSHYIGRAIDNANKYPKLNPKGSSPDIANKQALYNPDIKCVFVTEGIFDAMAIHEIAPEGCDAIALNSTANADKFLKSMEEKPSAAVLVICMDNDKAGRNAEAKLTQGLNDLQVDYMAANICGAWKDPADRLKNDRSGFIQSVQLAANAAAQPDNTADYFLQRKEVDCKSYQDTTLTGFKNLDDASGGFRPGLYVLAAISSLGKTTFAHQIAENIAAAGRHVLFFSMEQSILELTSKSLRRILSVKDMNSPITTLKIMEGSREFPVLEAEKFYSATIGRRLSIIEGNFDCDVKFITEYIKRYIRRNRCKPVVVVDYLQILQPAVDKVGRRATTKETVDITTTELKRLSRAQGIPILAISSVNRMNYTLPVDFEALKESGNIEFTADVVWGLQLHCLNEKLFAEGEKKTVQKRERVKECKRANPRELDLVCLKNRFGISSYVCNFKYHTKNDLFEPWTLTLADKVKTMAAADREVKTGGKKKSANTGYADPTTLPTWAQLMQPKQGTFFKMLQGRAYDVDGKVIELTYTTIAGRKSPAVKSPDGGNMVRILTEAEYNAILEYNLKRKTATADFADFSKGSTPEDQPF